MTSAQEAFEACLRKWAVEVAVDESTGLLRVVAVEGDSFPSRPVLELNGLLPEWIEQEALATADLGGPLDSLAFWVFETLTVQIGDVPNATKRLGLRLGAAGKVEQFTEISAQEGGGWVAPDEGSADWHM